MILKIEFGVQRLPFASTLSSLKYAALVGKIDVKSLSLSDLAIWKHCSQKVVAKIELLNFSVFAKSLF